MPAAIEAGTIIGGKYRLDGMLGKGGMGSVWAATNVAIGRRVAIKVLIAEMADRDDVKQRFELEAQAAAVIGHPGIVDVLDMGETDDGEPFIVMEHLEGATLKAVFKRLGVFTPGQAVAVAVPVLDALAAAHAAGVIHRDVKPANVFLCTRPTRLVKLLDFGISRFGKSTGLTVTGAAVGTPQYMAPEQVMGEKHIGPEVDLYSVGATLYQLLGGRPPYDADSDIATLAKLLRDTPRPLSEVRPELPPALSSLVDELLTRDPAQRPHDAAAVRDALTALAPPEPEALYELAGRLVRVDANGNPRPRTGSGSQGSRPSSARRATSSKVSRAATHEDAPPARTGVWVALGMVAFVALGGGAAWVALKPAKVVEAPAPELPAPAPVKPAPPSSVEVTLSAEPAQARFSVDGEALDCNPCTVSRSPGARVQVHVAAERFAATDLELTFDHTRAQHVSLAPLAEAVRPGPTVPAPPPPPGAKKPGKGLHVDEKNPYE
jgi:serine/threonine-protein kinase